MIRDLPVCRTAMPSTSTAAEFPDTEGYLTDLMVPGMLHAGVLRSPHPHARILSIDVSAAASLIGVRAVVTAADVPRDFLLGIKVRDRPVLARDVVRYIGEPIAAVAADSKDLVIQALTAIHITYDPLPVIDDPVEALKPGTSCLHPGGNLCHRTSHTRGNLETNFAAALHVVDDLYVTPRQAHAALELEGGVAVANPCGSLVIYSPSQHPHGVRDSVAEMLRLDPGRVDVFGSPIGGAFGGKEDLHVQPLLALLAAKSRRPVRLVLTRPESFSCTTTRHPFRIRMRTGCTAEGRLVAHEVDAIADTGAYATHGPEVLDNAHESAVGPYQFEAVRIECRLAYTNNGISGAFRGFGALQMQMALELQIERLARLCGLDPVFFRKINLRAADAPGPLGQSVLPQPEVAIVANKLAEHPLRGKLPNRLGRRRFGTGAALVIKGEGYGRGGPNAASGIFELKDGIIEFRCGLTEMGQGATAAMAAAIAKALNVSSSDVRAILGRTDIAPDAGPTSASRGTQVAIRLARSCASTLRAALLSHAARLLHIDHVELRLGPGGVYVERDLSNAPRLSFAELSATGPIGCSVSIDGIVPNDGDGVVHKVFTTCGAVAQVCVDSCTGRVTVENIAVIPACGQILVPDAFLGQVEGGAVMAAGFVLLEDMPADRGRYMAKNLDEYLIPTFADAPTVTIDPIEYLDPNDPIGIRGIGEIPLNAAAPAIAAAVFDAIGTPPTRFPIEASWVLEVLERNIPL
jgi:CO/xanthine dehydrogenase Mo-binding subunit